MGLSLPRWGARIPQATQGDPPKKSQAITLSSSTLPSGTPCQSVVKSSLWPSSPLPTPAQCPLYLSGLSWYFGDSTVSPSGTCVSEPLHSLTFFPGHPFPRNPSSWCLTSFWRLHTCQLPWFSGIAAAPFSSSNSWACLNHPLATLNSSQETPERYRNEYLPSPAPA